MSTAGKVLSVLSVLFLAVWIVLLSAVAELNTNWAKRRNTLTGQVAKLEADVAAAEASTLALRQDIDAEQVAKERSLRLVRSELARVESQVTTSAESLIRSRIQLDNYTKALESAREGLAIRVRERAELEKNQAEETANVERLRSENAAMLAELSGLRDRFKSVYEGNVKAVSQIRSADSSRPAPSPRPTPRSASFSR